MSGNDKFNFEIKRNGKGADEYHITKNSLPYIIVDADLVEETEKEIAQWYAYLNNIIGFISFTFALAVQGTPNVYFNAAIALIWVLIAHFWVEKNKFPQHLAYLRSSQEKGSKNLAVHIEKQHLSYWKIVKKAPLFLIGYLYLLLLTLMNFDYFKSLVFFGKTLSQHLLLK